MEVASNEIGLTCRWVSQIHSDYKWTLVKVMDWCRQNKPLPNWMLPKNLLLFCVTRPQWIILFTNPIRLRPQGRVSWTTGIPPGQYVQEFCSKSISTYLIRKPPSGRGTVPRTCRRQWSISPDCDLAQPIFSRVYKNPSGCTAPASSWWKLHMYQDDWLIRVSSPFQVTLCVEKVLQVLPSPSHSQPKVKNMPVYIQWFKIPPTNL